jgi:hypothetical protein
MRIVRSSISYATEAEPWAMADNHAVVRHDTIEDCSGPYAHLAHHCGRVAVGDHVATGTVIGEVGHTGNSSAPHLHFQLMSAADSRTATAIPCAFGDAQCEDADGAWIDAPRAVPGRHQRVRWNAGRAQEPGRSTPVSAASSSSNARRNA